MRLTSIKMAGFKSFVDPTTLDFPTSMVGVVGPNGCGKSNIIDAVRWVMGESSKHIRGDTMEDVIFNGSSTRKPIGQASIELVFDNSDGKLGGEYSSFAEIAVRRQATRDGTSKYFLNGTKCRRKDIVQLFLGTGLGPRSYAIIEQGMISRLIDAKPEELRVYLEEAAGISKYKERRRETEIRIRHTRENLDRLNDVIEEITKRIQHLQRQAKAAERYKVLKAEERQAKTELLALRWQAHQDEVQERKNAMEHKETESQKVVADIRAIEAEIEALRQQHADETELFNQVQGDYYKLGGEISRIEQSISHVQELNSRYDEELKQVQESWAQSEKSLLGETAKADELEQKIAEIEPSLNSARDELSSNSEKLGEAESEMAKWQDAWEALSVKIAEPAQIIEIEASRIEYLENHLEQLAERKDKLLEDLHRFSQVKSSRQSKDFVSRVNETSTALQAISPKIIELSKSISAGRDNSQTLGVQLEKAREQLQTKQTELSSLQALQRVVLGEEGKDVSRWLDQHGLSKAPRLMDKLKTEAGWEAAVETVLGDYLEAVCVDKIEQVASSVKDIKTGRMMVLSNGASYASTPSHALGETLVSKVKAPVDLSAKLGSIFIANDLQSALKKSASLESGQSVITRDGVWLGVGWLRVSRIAANKGNVLQRKNEILNLEKEVQAQQNEIIQMVSDLETCQRELYENEKQRDTVQASLSKAQKVHAQAEAEMSGWESEKEHVERQEEQLRDYLDDVDRQINQSEEELEESRASKQQADSVLEVFDVERKGMLEQRDSAVFHLDGVRSKEVERRESTHRLALHLESYRASLNATHASLERMKEHAEQLKQREQSLQQSIKDGSTPLVELNENLKEYVDQRVKLEHSLSDARMVAQKTEEQIHAKQEHNVETQRNLEQLRDELNELQLAWQEANVRSKTIQEQLHEYDVAPEAVLEKLEEDATLEKWEEKTQSLERKINRLGPINLAAIGEYEEHKERKEYLDKQHEDLSNALETLEDAIRKIDKETKDRFKDIFENVNSHLQAMFPRLFGGGKAFLEMTGDDLLTTGVAIMARPPGKRLSSIQLMSGGEKALTAVALVFSLFELNPAPFCLLDEVDAPLDDANVMRFCDLLKDMSDRVQFIYITHNKNTMEYASQLLGITMHEPGVSRIVSVDVDAAAELAAV
ncbi:MAG: chromosome segregation protein SMC [Gammaproteobacteria bacterium]|nr:chromosome segregation protein SMC [Gammaproteobacteria bacterium]